MPKAESRLGLEPREPLAESAMLAFDWAKHDCVQANGDHPGCAWYHGSWQVLRLLGVFHSILSDDDFFMPALTRLIDGGVRSVLISGAADYALLARVAAAAGSHAQDMRVTVIDLCNTPLQLNAWYGNKYGMDVEVVKGNVLEYRPSGAFDLICTHSFLGFFNANDRRRLLKRWWECLRPGGRVLTAQRVRTDVRQPIIAYSPDEVTALANRTLRKAQERFDIHAVDPQLAHKLAEDYGRHYWTYLFRTAKEIQSLFEDQGFKLDAFAPPGDEQQVVDKPGAPNQGHSARWRILASKLAD